MLMFFPKETPPRSICLTPNNLLLEKWEREPKILLKYEEVMGTTPNLDPISQLIASVGEYLALNPASYRWDVSRSLGLSKC